MQPSVGRIVHYRHPAKDGTVVLAAMIVKVFTDTCVNLHIFNDGYQVLNHEGKTHEDSLRTSVVMGDADQQWSWPPRV